MTKDEVVTKWVNDLVENGFMSGWFGDKSDKFRADQVALLLEVVTTGNADKIGGHLRLVRVLYSDITNLQQYCGWTEKEITALLDLFGFKKTDHVAAMTNVAAKDIDRFMQNAKLKKEVFFRLTPMI